MEEREEEIWFNKNKYLGPYIFQFKNGSIINYKHLTESSQVKIQVQCEHKIRTIRWSRRYQPCRICAHLMDKYKNNKTIKGRIITWGDKISQAKKGKKFTEEHKKALLETRIKKFCNRANTKREDFEQFPTKGYSYKLRIFAMSAIKHSMMNKTINESDVAIIDKLGYSINDLKVNLESKFKEGMTWDNFGRIDEVRCWEIDHIKPASWFSYDSVDDKSFKECFALENLQPLWADENRKKNNLYMGKFKDKIIYFLCGQSGVGKTTLALNFIDKFNIVQDDLYSNVKKRDEFICNHWYEEKPILLDIGIHISTTYRRYIEKGYKVRAIFLIEEPNKVIENINKRGGRVDNVNARYNRIINMVNTFAYFKGNTEEVRNFLINLNS